ncbi:1,4-dihydroxy-2-naphthoate polyprenyltransferase [Nitriliruptoraceae bacterium ZYF776]|nr:1,4-dihydroxy-2-naphthoate polyprenyltransferase [Profundirhabdus halotolerans]
MHPYLEAARPRTLPAAVAPVLVGTAAAATAPRDLDPVRALLALFVALALQVAVNYANDYFDGVKGVDTEARVGPRRAVATGLITPGAMKRAMLVALAVGALAGLGLAALAGWELLLVGVAALLATLGYSGGSKPYASAGLGEVFVFVFFGVVATVGSAYVQDEAVTTVAVVASLPMGALATALLVVNNLRDVPTDREVGKRTLAVRLGERRTRVLYAGLVVASYLTVVALVLVAGEGWVALPLLSLPLAWPAVTTVTGGARGGDLVGALGHTARTQLVFAALLALGLVVAS